MGERKRRLEADARGITSTRGQARGTHGTAGPIVVTDPAPRRSRPASDFKVRRRMFALVAGEVRVAEVGDRRFHREWLSDVSDDEFRRIVRGYHLAPDVVFYRGGFGGVSRRDIEAILPALRDAMDLPEGTVVYSGARPDGPDDDLVGSDRVGTVGSLTRD